jgi:hypothetical protein
VSATSGDLDRLSVYAALRAADGALTVMVVNKTGGDLTSAVSLTGFAPTAGAQVLRYGPIDLAAVRGQPDQPTGGGSFTATFPASSITLLIVPAGTGPGPTPTPTVTPTPTFTPTPTATSTPTPTPTPTPMGAPGGLRVRKVLHPARP